MKTTHTLQRILAIGGLCVVAASGSHAATRTWGGSTGGDWFTAGNWTENAVPAGGDDVVVSSGAILLTNATAELGSFVITNASLTFTNWTTALNATNVTIRNGGDMTHPLCNTNGAPGNTHRVRISCSHFTVDLGGGIDVSGKGYAGVNGKPGQGPGGSASGYRNGGAGHGSQGGSGKSSGGGQAYGSAADPTAPGSSGGAPSGYVGGHGGGVIRIEATGNVTVNGSLAADGAKGSGIWTGSGAGGSIYISGNTIEGTTGDIRANGGPRAYGDCGGGGGGRIAISYNTTAQGTVSPQPALKISAAGREDYYSGLAVPGTLWIENSVFLPATFSADAIGNVAVRNVTSFAPGSLTVSNVWVRFASSGAELTVGGEAQVAGSSGRLDVSNGVLAVSGDLVVTNGAVLHVYGGDTNATTPVHGAVVNVTNDLIAGPSSWIHPHSHATNGLSPFFTCRSLCLATDGGFDANGAGYPAGPPGSDGRGPGAVSYVNAYGQGAGYGGQGGRASSGAGGPAYGSAAAPAFPGSSGVSGQGRGASGGGLVRVVAASNVTVNGSVLANGNDSGGFGGGGSGGGVYITCATFSGGGLISADGGNGGYYNNPGAYDSAGGGGRVAIVYDVAAQSNMPKPSVRFSVNGAIDYGHGQQGTLYLSDDSFFPYTVLDGGYTIVIPGFTSWAPDSLSITNGWVRFPDGFTLATTNDILVSGADTRLIVSNNTIGCGGNMLLTNGAQAQIYSAPTNGVSPDYGALVAVTGALAMATNSIIYPYSHPTNGGSVLFRVGDLAVAAGARIDAEGLGYGVLPPGSGTGLGPGAGTGGPTYAAGSGYGGTGGGSSSHPSGGGPTYGSSNAPVHPGSSGVSGQNGNQSGGGGLVRVEATGTVSVDGTITVNGGPNAGQFMGGGSGGGIFIECRTLTGAAGGLMAANGAKEGAGDQNGAGGGGRIAIVTAGNTFLGSVAASGAVHDVHATYPTRSGGDGTVVWISRAVAITNLYATDNTGISASLVGELTATGAAPAHVFCFWGTNDVLDAKASWGTNDYLGTPPIGHVTNNISNLTGGTLYYYRFYASNEYHDAWGEPTAFFASAGGAVSLDNDAGATAITTTAATLRGEVLIASPDPDTYVCWGDNDPGADDTSQWDRVVSIGPKLGTFQTDISGLLANKTYYYRCYATNVNGDGWAPTATNFTTLVPTMSIADPVPIVEGNAGTKDLDFTVTLSATSGVDVTVLFATGDGSAVGGTDYVATNGVLLIPASNTAAGTVRVLVNGDAADEYPSETFALLLSAPTNATLTDAEATGVITDDDTLVETKTWSGVGEWSSVTNWSPAGEPGPGDSVVVSSGALRITDVTEMLQSLTVGNASVSFSNWNARLNATTVTIAGGGTLTHALCDVNAAPGNTNRVYISCSDLTVELGGKIDVSEKGYAGVNGQAGQGPGGSASGYRNGGAGHGGPGGSGKSYGGGSTYGSASAPTAPGSSGGAPSGYVGGHGGGAIRIEATGKVTLNGTLDADGGTGSGIWTGSGAGGSIYITCDTLEGETGDLHASGGPRAYFDCGGGGGGRIAISYNTTAQGSVSPQPTLKITTAGREDYYNSVAQPGTLWLPDGVFLPTAFSPAPSVSMPDVVIRGVTSFAPASLTISNTWIGFAEPGFEVTVGGDLLVTGGGRLDLFSGPTNGASPDYGALVAVNGTLTVATNCTVYPYSDSTNGGSMLFRVGNLTIDSGGRIDAEALGFGVLPPGSGTGLGPGAGTGGATFAAGSGYGGVGGGSSSHPSGGGPTYGSSNAPVHPGSSGVSGQNGSQSAGGGLVRVEAASTVTVDGTITANGEPGAGQFMGGGSGGGIYIQCRKITGGAGGLIEANGAKEGADDRNGAGGGGRIAVWHTAGKNTFLGSVTASGAVHDDHATYPTRSGGDGTVVWIETQAPGTVFLIR